MLDSEVTCLLFTDEAGMHVLDFGRKKEANKLLLERVSSIMLNQDRSGILYNYVVNRNLDWLVKNGTDLKQHFTTPMYFYKV